MGKPSTQSTVDDCIGEWELSELEVIFKDKFLDIFKFKKKRHEHKC